MRTRTRTSAIHLLGSITHHALIALVVVYLTQLPGLWTGKGLRAVAACGTLISVRTCELCGRPITPRNRYGFCHRTLACRAAYEASRRVEHGLGPSGQACRLCGGPIQRGSKWGICHRNQECRRACNSMHMRARRTLQRCTICGGRVRSDSLFNICQRTLECRRASKRMRARARRAYQPRACDVCGGPIRDTNRYGVCDHTQTCRTARYRLRNQFNWRQTYERNKQLIEETSPWQL